MTGLFSKPKVETQPLPEPLPPVAIGEKGEAEITKRGTAIKAGRGGTILAGELTPEKIGKKRILG